MLNQSKMALDLAAAADAIRRGANSTWWEWDDGSRPFHWRWPKEYQTTIRDGLPVYVSPGEETIAPQGDTMDPTQKAAMIKKLRKVRERGYITKAEITSLTNFFPVAKGLEDIRMVYDGTKSGLNDRIWVPHFALASLDSALRCVEIGTSMGDIDIGEMFLNFILHCSLVPLCGVDLTLYFPEEILEGEKVLHEAWTRTGMGFKWSPYQAVQAVMFAEEVIAGDHRKAENVFRWDEVRMNLPGMLGYDPSLPWVSKIRKTDGRIAADFKTFVDDNRHSGPSRRECWKAGRKVGSTLNHLGIQDAARKRRDASTTPGAWAGCVILVQEDGVFVLVSEDKWAKTKSELACVEHMLSQDAGKMDREKLTSVRGFLQYVSTTYPSMKPYMIGFHQTIDGWRPNRDDEGNKLAKPGKYRIPNALFGTEAIPNPSSGLITDVHGPPPALVKAVPRFRSDVAALKALTSADKPPLRKVRCDKTAFVIYGFGDASGPGFGSLTQAFQIGNPDTTPDIHYEYGQWRTDVRQEKSSNWRELGNLVEALEAKGAAGDLTGVECFFCTDNSVAEAAHGKGYSQSPALCDLVLRLYLLEMRHSMILHLVHVSGKRMIHSGGDGLSRGDKASGAMLGKDVRSFVPFHLDAPTRSSALKEWIRALVDELKGVWMEPEDWFRAPQAGKQVFVWTPAPAAADVVMEQLSFARHKRPGALHIVIVPRIMTRRWRKRLIRATDFYTNLDNEELWPMAQQFEPLLMFVALPFVVHRPEFKAREALLARLGRALRGPALSEIHTQRARSGVCELLLEARTVYSL